MQLYKKEIDGGVIVTIKENRIDMAISRKFREELSTILQKKPPVMILDLTETEYLDSSALGTLVTILREAKAFGGEIRLAAMNQTLRTLMKLSKLDAMFKIYDTVEDATP